MQITGTRRSLRSHLAALFLSAFVFLLTRYSVVSYATSDPFPSLLVSQAIVEHRTLKLGKLLDDLDTSIEPEALEGMLNRRGEDYLYYFSPGPSIFSAPFVGVARLLGLDMRAQADNVYLQEVLSALLCAVVFFFIYLTADAYLERPASIAVAVVSVLGSTLTSTMGTALWNHGFLALFVSLSLLLIARYEVGLSGDLHPYLLGGLLFAAFASRPTAGIFVALVLGYLFFKHRQVIFRTAIAALLFLLLFVGVSYLEYGNPLPDYYDISTRWQYHSRQWSIWTALYGHTLSPSRGLFIFSPFFALALLVGARYFRQVASVPWVGLSLAWVGLHLVVSSRAATWWGGHSFGPRLLTDIVPALAFLTVLVWSRVAGRLDRSSRAAVAGGYLALGAFAVFIHSFQGLFNLHTQMWNGAIPPSVDEEPGILLDWRYPQFLATSRSVCARNSEYLRQQVSQGALELDGYRFGNHIDYFDEVKAAFPGWSWPEDEYRWSQCEIASVLIRLDENDPPEGSYRLALQTGSLGYQEAEVSINGTPVGRLVVDSYPWEPTTVSLPFGSEALRPGVVNEIEFRLPGARLPIRETGGLLDQRRLGLALVDLAILKASP